MRENDHVVCCVIFVIDPKINSRFTCVTRSRGGESLQRCLRYDKYVGEIYEPGHDKILARCVCPSGRTSDVPSDYRSFFFFFITGVTLDVNENRLFSSAEFNFLRYEFHSLHSL